MGMERKPEGTYYLMCERTWVYHILMGVAGLFGAYTYLLRGNVFCNAQTGNVVLMGMALGSGEWGQALYYLIPISAYLLGGGDLRAGAQPGQAPPAPALGHPARRHRNAGGGAPGLCP